MARGSIDRTPDGRMAVYNHLNEVIGLHNSMRSAQRQLEDYLTPAEEQAALKGNGTSATAGKQQMQSQLEQGAAGAAQGGVADMQHQAAMQDALHQQMQGQQRQAAGISPLAAYAEQHPMSQLGANEAAGWAGAAQPAPQIGTAAHTQLDANGYKPGHVATNQDLAAGMAFGQAFTAQHPNLNPAQLGNLAHQQQQQMLLKQRVQAAPPTAGMAPAPVRAQ